MFALDHAEQYKFMYFGKCVERHRDTQIETQIQLCLTRNMLDELTGKSSYKQNVTNMVVFDRESAAVKIAVLRIFEVVQVQEGVILTWQQVVC